MKTLIRWSLIAMVATLLNRAEAAYTNYLDQASNAIALAYSFVPNPPPKEQRVAFNALKKALADFSRRSTSVAGDFDIFLAAATHLVPIQKAGSPDPTGIGLGMTNAFLAFAFNVVIESTVLSNRVAALSQFQPQKRAASNQVWQAQREIVFAATTTNVQAGILSIRVAYFKLAVAAKLAAAAEARPGFAPNSVVGKSLEHHERGGGGTLHFDDATHATETAANPEPGEGPRTDNYTYTRTGLNTATLVLTEDDGGVTTVKLIFTSTTGGRFTFKNVEDGRPENGAGTFTIN